MPTKAHDDDAGFDLYVSRACHEMGLWVCHSDIAFEIPNGYVGLVFPRSSISKTDMRLANSVGVIDAGYRGEVSAKFDCNPTGKRYQTGDRFAQIIFIPYPNITLQESDELTDTQRGDGGYGSSGK